MIMVFFIWEMRPRFGIPEMVLSDNRKAFVEKTWKEIMQALGMKQRRGCIYHPQSQGWSRELKYVNCQILIG